MAEVLSQASGDVASSAIAAPLNLERNKPTLAPVTIPNPPASQRSGHLNLGIFSPVNQNGSFEFDRVLRSGEVHIRARKTKA